MRKILIKTAVLGMLTAAVMTMTAAAAVVGTGVVDADSLRVRSEPNTKCTTLSYLIGGTKVRVHEVLDGWYKISYGETTGYVSADYLDFTAADPAEQQEKAEEKKEAETKAAAKKTAEKKPAAKKSEAKKADDKKPAAKKSTAKKADEKKPAKKAEKEEVR